MQKVNCKKGDDKMSCTMLQQGKPSVLEFLALKSKCDSRETNKDGFVYCLVNDRNCPYADTGRYITNFMGSFYPCRYFKVFDEVEKEVQK